MVLDKNTFGELVKAYRNQCGWSQGELAERWGYSREYVSQIAGLANDFSLDKVLQEQASGFTELWKPEKAIEIYKETDRLRPFRPLRDQGAYIINKAQAYLHLGDLDQGITLALKGIQPASEYRSKRHIGWIDKTYHRLLVLPVGQDKRLNTLKDALREVRREQVNW